MCIYYVSLFIVVIAASHSCDLSSELQDMNAELRKSQNCERDAVNYNLFYGGNKMIFP